jgi:hypothetical protein
MERPDSLTLVVVALTLVAFGLRIAGLDQDLFGDELFTIDDVHGRDLTGVVERVKDGYEDNPPLFFLLAWATAKLGDPTIWIRVPSLLLGTASVPLVYALGRQALGRAAGVVAAAIVAISPFTVFYGGEARAYAALMCLSALSTVALLRALKTGRTGWWVAYALGACGVLYTHYSGAFVLLAQAGWGLWFYAEFRLPIVAANLAAVAAYIPWLTVQLTKDPTYTRLPSLTPRYVLTTVMQALPGHPLERPRDLPGRALLVLFALTTLVAVALAIRSAYRRRSSSEAGRARILTLLFLLAVATPIGLVIVSTGEHNILLPRGLSASLPAAAVLVGFVLTAPRAPASLVVVTVALTVLLIGTVSSLRDPPRNTGFRDVAHFIDAERNRDDAVIYLSLYHHAPHPLAGFVAAYLDDDDIPVREVGVNDGAAWRRAAGGGRIFFVLQPIVVLGKPLELPPRAGPGGCFTLDSRKVVSTSPPLLLGTYSVHPPQRRCARLALGRGGPARAEIRLRRGAGTYIGPWFGRRVKVAREPADGRLTATEADGRHIDIQGVVRTDPVEPTWILTFDGARLVASGVAEASRPDVAREQGLPPGMARFRIRGEISPGSGTEQHLKTFVVSRDRAAALTR